MLQKFKKMIPFMAAVMLFSSTIAYANVYDIDVYMSPGVVAYSECREKTTENESARVVSIGSPDDCFIRYRVVNNAGYQKSEQKTVTIVSTDYLSYEGYNIQKGDYIKLRAENNAADNSGGFVTLQTRWTR